MLFSSLAIQESYAAQFVLQSVVRTTAPVASRPSFKGRE